jgi:polar amino acid transport system substrate-binding protein
LDSLNIKTILIALMGCLSIPYVLAQDRQLKACGNDEYPPWNWMQDSQIVGVCTDLAQKAFASKGYTLDVTYVGPWARCQALLNSGVVDVSLCAVPTVERSNSLHIIEPSLAYNEIAAFVLVKNSESYRSLERILGSRIGMIRGVRLGEPIDSLLDKSGQIIYSTRLESLWSLLVLGRIDVVLFGREAGNIQIKQLKLDGRVVAVSPSVSKVPLNIMVSKKSNHFEELLNDFYAIGQSFLSKDHLSQQVEAIRVNGIKYIEHSNKTLPLNIEK